jgi:hypothetical protein
MECDAITRNLGLRGGPELLEMAKMVPDTKGKLEE